MINFNISHYESFTGLPTQDDDARVRRWAALTVKVVFAVLIVGVILAAILWTLNADVGALTLSAVFAASAGLMVLRQALLAERR